MKITSKFTAIILGIAAFFAFSVLTFAVSDNLENRKVQDFGYIHAEYINPVYEDVIDEINVDFVPEEEFDTENSTNSATGYYDNYKEAGESIRYGLKNRMSTITVNFTDKDFPENGTDEEQRAHISKIGAGIFEAAFLHSGNPKEGDYIKWQFGGSRIGANIKYNSSTKMYEYKLTLLVSYYTTEAQEKELDTAIDNLLASLNLEGKSQYDKIIAVHNYIRDNVTYDYANLENDGYALKYTAYAALVNKTCVCQGYANLFYRLMLELGIDTRIIAGTGNGGEHAWNIVRLDDKYYDIDSTWDASTNSDRYCLLCETHFDDHIRNAEYDTEEFKAEYPVSQYCHELEEDEHFYAGGWCGTEGYQGKNLGWHISKDGVLTVFGTGEMADYNYGEAPWYEYRNIITKLVLEEGMENIGNYAFYDCDMAGDLVIPESVTRIGESAFAICSSLDGTLTIGSNVTSIGKNAFYSCRRLSGDVVVPEGVTVIEEGVFKNCRGFDGDIIIGSKVTEIKDEAFYDCGAYSMEMKLPETLEKIGKKAFYICGVNNYYFMGGAPEVYSADTDYYSFNVSSDKMYYFYGEEGWNPEESTWNGYTAKMVDYGYCGAGENRKNVSWKIKDKVLIITGEGAISDFNRTSTSDKGWQTEAPWRYFADKINAVSIGEGITHIGKMAFYECDFITSEVVLPESLVSIGRMAFEGCSGIGEKITIPENVESIGENAFCSVSVKEYIFEGDAPNVYPVDNTYRTFDSDVTIYYSRDKSGWEISTDGRWNGYTAKVLGGENILARGYCGAEGDGTNLEWILDKDGVLTISGHGAMADYGLRYNNGGAITLAPWGQYPEELKTLVLSEGITTIGVYAFYGCGFTGNLVIPESVKVINGSAFSYCYKFDGDLVIPKNVETIGNYAFRGCSGFKGTLTIGSGVKTIGKEAFESCKGFTGNLVIPENVTSIGTKAFYECIGFNGSLILSENLEKIEEYTFYSCSGFTGDIVIPEKVTVIGNYAFAYCTGLNGTITFGNNVQTIEKCAFYNCKNVSGTITVPESVESIGGFAFYGCGITDVYFKGDAPSVIKASESSRSFEKTVTITYHYEKDGWNLDDDGKWRGYKVFTIYKYGDINGDGKINVIDANMVRKAAVKKIALTDEQKVSADVNGDGKVNVIDANIIRKYAVKLITSFPVEG